MDISGKRFVVVGGSGVLGGEIAADLLRRGATVEIVARSGATRHGELANCTCVAGDVQDATSLEQAFGELGGEFDGVINATGVVAFGALHDMPPAVVATVMNTNALGTLHLLGQARQRVREGGVYVNLTGVAAEMSLIGMSTYCASKSAARAATAVAAREFRTSKIRVIDVRAPHTETGLTSRALFGEAPKMPNGADPQHVAQRIVDAIGNDETDLPATAFE